MAYTCPGNLPCHFILTFPSRHDAIRRGPSRRGEERPDPTIHPRRVARAAAGLPLVVITFWAAVTTTPREIRAGCLPSRTSAGRLAQGDFRKSSVVVFGGQKHRPCPFHQAIANRRLLCQLPKASRSIQQPCIGSAFRDSWTKVGPITRTGWISARNRPDGTPVTMLTGQFVDQAALGRRPSYPLDLGFPLLKVERLEA